MTRTTPAITVQGLSKHYKAYGRPSDILKELLTGRKRHHIVQSLNDINLAIGEGEVVGILGRNGAGKSTLLRIIAGTLDSTAGAVTTRGRIAAILELGTGFHPDFTGRENIYLGGMCLGLKRHEIDDRLDEIIDFAEIGDFVDLPFRTYSTGMRARLTFATATSVDPDILIIDEALSVGDAKFQRKSFKRIEDFRIQGKTILFVSHDLNAITAICDRAVLLEYGRVVADGKPKDVIHRYQRLLFGDADPTPRPVDADATQASAAPSSQPAAAAPDVSGPASRFGNGTATITDVQLLDEAGTPTSVVAAGQPCAFRMAIEYHADTPLSVPGFIIRTTKGIDVFGMDTQWARLPSIPASRKGAKVSVTLTVNMHLAAGDYFLTVALAQDDGQKLDLHYDALHFQVSGTSRIFTTSLVDLQGDISVDVTPAGCST